MKQSQAKKRDNAMTNKILMGLIALVLGLLFLEILIVHSKNEQQKNASNQVQTARIMANGDLLYHDALYMSALQADGSYDFTENFTYVKPWLKQADLVLGDFEGTINPDYPLSGYPLFNAPQSVTAAIKDAGYDVMDLAHNHILDSGLEGAFTTADAFKKVGIDPIGVYEKPVRDKAPLLIKNVNGIKVAILSYAYGYNGLESNLTDKEVADHLSNLDEKRMKAEIQRAEKEADIYGIYDFVLDGNAFGRASGPESERCRFGKENNYYHKIISTSLQERCDYSTKDTEEQESDYHSRVSGCRYQRLYRQLI